MRKALLGLLLLLWMLMLRGYAQWETGAAPASNYESAITGLDTTVQPQHSYCCETLRPAASSNKEKAFFKIDPSEVKEEREGEDELSVGRKHVESSHFFTSFIFAHQLGEFFNTDHKVSPSYKSFAATTSQRYIEFLVFRI